MKGRAQLRMFVRQTAGACVRRTEDAMRYLKGNIHPEDLL